MNFRVFFIACMNVLQNSEEMRDRGRYGSCAALAWIEEEIMAAP
jgi:hypothetical protein